MTASYDRFHTLVREVADALEKETGQIGPGSAMIKLSLINKLIRANQATCPHKVVTPMVDEGGHIGDWNKCEACHTLVEGPPVSGAV